MNGDGQFHAATLSPHFPHPQGTISWYNPPKRIGKRRHHHETRRTAQKMRHGARYRICRCCGNRLAGGDPFVATISAPSRRKGPWHPQPSCPGDLLNRQNIRKPRDLKTSITILLASEHECQIICKAVFSRRLIERSPPFHAPESECMHCWAK